MNIVVCAPSGRTHVVLLHSLRMVQMVSDAMAIVCALSINGRNDDDANVRQCDYIERAEGKLKMNEQMHMHMFPAVFISIYVCVCQYELLVPLQASITSMSLHSPVDVTGVASRNGGQNV